FVAASVGALIVTAGNTWSFVTDSTALGALTFPRLSVEVAVIEFTPLVNAVVAVMLNVPAEEPVPISVVPLNTFTVVPDVAVPVNTGNVLLVIKSLLNGPLSLPPANEIVGVVGGVLFT